MMAENQDLRVKQQLLEQKVISLESMYDRVFQLQPAELMMLLQEISRLLSERQKMADIAQFAENKP